MCQLNKEDDDEDSMELCEVFEYMKRHPSQQCIEEHNNSIVIRIIKQDNNKKKNKSTTTTNNTNILIQKSI